MAPITLGGHAAATAGLAAPAGTSAHTDAETAKPEGNARTPRGKITFEGEGTIVSSLTALASFTERLVNPIRRPAKDPSLKFPNRSYIVVSLLTGGSP